MTTRAKGTILLEMLTKYADNDWVCPSLPKLAELTGLDKSTVGEYLRRLRKTGAIRSRLVHVKPHGQARIVTIVETGKSTRTPTPSTRYNRPAELPFKPTATALTSSVRRLTGKEFARRAAELLAREAELQRKREMDL